MPLLAGEQRLREIRNLHSAINEAWRTTVRDAIRIGELLTEQKESLKHGQWTKWMKDNLPFSRQSANNFMKLFRHRDIVKTLTVSDLKSTLRELNRILAEPDPVPNEHEVTFTLSTEEKEEFDEIVNDLMEKVFHVTNVKETVLAALRFTLENKEPADEDRTLDNRVA